MRARGNLIRYAPITPAMAPLAPMVGTWRIRIHDDVNQGRRHSAGQIEKQILRVAQNFLHSSSENPQEPHVPQDVQPAAMDEHGRHHRGGVQAVRNDSVAGDEVIKPITAQAQLVEKNQHVQRR